MEVSLQAAIVAVVVVPGKVTVLDVVLKLVGVAPKPLPVIVTEAPTAPEVGLSKLIVGVMVKSRPLVVTPLAVTVTSPVVAPVGTVIPIEEALQLVMVAGVPLSKTVPCVVPRFCPVIVTEAPGNP